MDWQQVYSPKYSTSGIRDERWGKKLRASLSMKQRRRIVLQEGFVDVYRDDAMKEVVISDVISFVGLIAGADDDNIHEFWIIGSIG